MVDDVARGRRRRRRGAVPAAGRCGCCSARTWRAGWRRRPRPTSASISRCCASSPKRWRSSAARCRIALEQLVADVQRAVRPRALRQVADDLADALVALDQQHVALAQRLLELVDVVRHALHVAGQRFGQQPRTLGDDPSPKLAGSARHWAIGCNGTRRLRVCAREKCTTPIRADARRVRRFQRRLLAWYRRERPEAALAADPRPLPDPGVRGHAAADPGRPGEGILPALRPPVPDLRRPGRRRRSRRCASRGTAWATTPAPATCTRRPGIVVAEHGGRLPDDAQLIRQLPGIGRYTAGAVLEHRLRAATSRSSTPTPPACCRACSPCARAAASARCSAASGRSPRTVTPAGEAGDFNQAIMDLGATICRRAARTARRCPVRRGCATRSNDDGSSDEPV